MVGTKGNLDPKRGVGGEGEDNQPKTLLEGRTDRNRGEKGFGEKVCTRRGGGRGETKGKRSEKTKKP